MNTADEANHIKHIIVLIGAGELGSRHLQSLVRIGPATKITVLELSEDAVLLARERMSEIAEISDFVAKVEFVKALEQLPASIDLAVIATGAAPRMDILRRLLVHSRVKYMLLEKVLFQNLDEYEEASVLLENLGIEAWVNCPRRMFNGYGALKLQLDLKQPIEMRVKGGEWGLACNAIHYIDIFAFLTGSCVQSVDVENLESTIYPSKRSGYVEFFGSMSVQFENGHKLVLDCSHDQTACLISIVDSEGLYDIDESSGMVLKNAQKTNITIISINQSDLTQVFAEQVLAFGRSNLTTYTESSALHQPFISSLLSFYNEKNKIQITSLPIT
ncbi:Gfo/Idh/MocA family oxidoreductase [Pseudomonadales bacterium]|nr:Gfo/Idh/MocA family oxidoreductase [Pseudomonadales bacterium]